MLAIRQLANDLVNNAREQGVDATHLQDEIDNLTDRINDLQGKLDDRCNDLQSAATAVAQFNDHVKALNYGLTSLENEFDSMKAPGRDIKTVRAQIEEVAKLINKINRASDEVADLVNASENLVDSGFAADSVATRDQVETLKRQLGKLDERARARDEELACILNKLQEFYHLHGDIMDDINEASDQVKRFKAVGSEVDSIKAQQEDFHALKVKKIEPLARAVDECNIIGQGLVQSAGRDVNTSGIEKDLDKMHEKWNELKDRVSNRT